MEARRTFQAEAKSSRPIWIVVAVVLAVLALGVASAYLAKGLTSASAPASGHVVQTSFQAPDAMERNAQILSARSGSSPIDGSSSIERNTQKQYPFSETHGH